MNFRANRADSIKKGNIHRVRDKQSIQYTHHLCRSLDCSLEPAGTLLVDGQEILSELLQKFAGNGRIHVHEPLFIVRRERNLVIGPLTSEMNAEAGDDRRRKPATPAVHLVKPSSDQSEISAIQPTHETQRIINIIVSHLKHIVVK